MIEPRDKTLNDGMKLRVNKILIILFMVYCGVVCSVVSPVNTNCDHLDTAQF